MRRGLLRAGSGGGAAAVAASVSLARLHGVSAGVEPGVGSCLDRLLSAGSSFTSAGWTELVASAEESGASAGVGSAGKARVVTAPAPSASFVGWLSSSGSVPIAGVPDGVRSWECGEGSASSVVLADKDSARLGEGTGGGETLPSDLGEGGSEDGPWTGSST